MFLSQSTTDLAAAAKLATDLPMECFGYLSLWRCGCYLLQNIPRLVLLTTGNIQKKVEQSWVLRLVFGIQFDTI